MLPYQSLIVIDKKNGVTIYRQIANKLISLIQSGKITPGSYLPGTREMAFLLQVHRNTIVHAYDELVIQGWLRPEPQKGYLVIPELPVVKPRSFHPEQHFPDPSAKKTPDFNHISYDNLLGKTQNSSVKLMVDDGFPDIELVPFEEIMKSYRKLLHSDGMKEFMIAPYENGAPVLKQSISNFLNQTRGLNISPANVLITRGAQQAIYLAAAILLNPGDHVAVSHPNYFMADEIFRQRGAVLHSIPVDDNGMDVDRLEVLLKSLKIKLLYVIPHHHHPTTATMSASRRLKLLNLIEKHDLRVIEDDYDYDFHYQNAPILPLASANHGGRILYIGSFTKMLTPSFRIGYLIGANAFLAAASAYRRLIDIRGDSMMEYAIAGLIDSGEMYRHIKRSRKIYAERCDYAFELLKTHLSAIADFHKPQGGMAIWLKFKPEYPLESILRDAQNRGIQFSGSAYYKGRDSCVNGFRFGFASLSKENIRKAIIALAEATDAKKTS